MPIVIKNEDGTFVRIENAEYLPAYFFIPKDILAAAGKECASLPRTVGELKSSRAALEFVESDLFFLLICDAFAFMVWRFMGIKAKREIYSGYEPSWKFAHAPDYWIKELTDQKIIPTVEEFFELPNDFKLDYVPILQVEETLARIVPQTMQRYNMNAIIDVAKEYRCEEDFDWRDSFQKRDFIRKWYHTRWKYKQISYENYLKGVREDWEQYRDIADVAQDTTEATVAKIKAQEFADRLTAVDKRILRLRLEGRNCEEIAKVLGYANHSGIVKRIAKLRRLWVAFESEYEI